MRTDEFDFFVSDKIFATIPLNTLSVGFIEYDNQKSIKIPTGSRKPDEAVAVFLFDAFVVSFMLRKQLLSSRKE